MTYPDKVWQFVIYYHGLDLDVFWQPYLREHFWEARYLDFEDDGVVGCCII